MLSSLHVSVAAALPFCYYFTHSWGLQIHCLAGKGRTGTIIASYLLFCGLFDNSDQALNYFAIRRSVNKWGVTGPSQLRYVRYFEAIFKRNIIPSSKPLLLKTLSLHNLPRYSLSLGRHGISPIFAVYEISTERKKIFAWGSSEESQLPSYPVKFHFHPSCIV